jgi:GTPase
MYDSAVIKVKAGSGGNGVITFRREKFIPFGGPNGGDGGNGGHVDLIADDSITSLLRFKPNMIFKGQSGEDGTNKQKHGKAGADLIIPVPPGTIVSRYSADGEVEILGDLEHPGDTVRVARGGKGGWGNVHYTTSTNQAPHIAQRGEPGQENTILLEMRIIADAGIVGFPNAGKSTLLTAASQAKPKIAEYPFTTLEPILGVVEVGEKRFVLAEIPGLIKDAHLGKGLGLEFLRHVMRTKVLIHIISGNSSSPIEDMICVNGELAAFDQSLARKPQVVAINKIDLPEVQEKKNEIDEVFRSAGIKPFFISAATGEGVPQLMKEVWRVLKDLAEEAAKALAPSKVFHPRPKDRDISITKVDDVYVMCIPEVERYITGPGASAAELRLQINQHLSRLGVNRLLRKAGVKPGDKIRCGKTEWEWSSK